MSFGEKCDAVQFGIRGNSTKMDLQKCVCVCVCVWSLPVQEEGVVSLQVSLEDAEFPDELSNYELHNEDSVP